MPATRQSPRWLVIWGGTVALLDRAWHETGVMSLSSASAFAGFRFPREVISVAVRWYLRYGLSYRDVEELLAERGVDVDHVTVYWWGQRFTPEFVEAARTCRQVPGDRWFVDETYVKVNGRWTYLYRAVDQFGQVIDVWLSARRDLTAARTFFTRALATGAVPVEVTTDRATAAGAGRAHPGCRARHRAVCEQHDRSRPWSAQSAASTDAWPQDVPISSDPCRRSCLRPKHQPRPLRDRHRRTGAASATGGVR